VGYRSTFVTEDVYFPLPDWFTEKWTSISYGEMDGKPAFPIASKFERKFYSGVEEELFTDLARVLKENDEDYPREIILVLLHEDGEIDRVIITGDKVKLQSSLKYQDDDCDNWQFGTREKKLVIKEN
jgi:hypothetical protein